MLSVLAALCALRDHSGMSWAMAIGCEMAHTGRNSCNERTWDARAQGLFRLRCRRRFEPLVRCGARIVPDAIEFRDQVCVIRRKAAADSDASRPLIPTEAG